MIFDSMIKEKEKGMKEISLKRDLRKRGKERFM